MTKRLAKKIRDRVHRAWMLPDSDSFEDIAKQMGYSSERLNAVSKRLSRYWKRGPEPSGRAPMPSP